MTPNYTVAVLHPIAPTLDLEQKMLTPYGAQVFRLEAKNEDEIIAAAGDANVICVGYEIMSQRVIQNLRNCRAIVKYGVGVDNIDIEAATKRGIWVANIPDYGTDEVATHAIALLLNAIRHISKVSTDMRNGKWTPVMPYLTQRSQGRTLGIVGFGRIGRSMARKAQGFEWRVLAYDPNVNPSVVRENGAEPVDFETLLKEADYISIHASLNESSYHLFNENAFKLVKPGAHLVNTSRGSIVDTNALIAAIENGKLASAAIDVFEVEPLPPDHPLLKSERVVTTPHCAFYSTQSIEDIRVKAIETIIDILSGRPPYSLLNPEAGVRNLS